MLLDLFGTVASFWILQLGQIAPEIIFWLLAPNLSAK
jgi:hypothetical protein